MLCLTGTTGNIGSATLHSILSHSLISPTSLVVSTSTPTSSICSNSTLQHYASLGIQIRHASYDDPASMVEAYRDCTALFLVSTPKIALDFGDVEDGKGRESQHIKAIDAAVKAGVKHIYYTSLAFGIGLPAGSGAGMTVGSKAGVMKAHERTEKYLAQLADQGKLTYTSIREGLYAESWPLYFGQYDPKGDERKEVVVGGDGLVSWTRIEDLGLGTALILKDGVESEKWRNKTIYLAASRAATLADVAKVVSRVKGHDIALSTVSRTEYEELSIEKRGMQGPFVKWWSGSYEALKDGECNVKDGTLEDLLNGVGKECGKWEDVVEGMLKGEIVYQSSEGRRG